MPPWVERYLDTVRELYARLTRQQKIFLASAAALLAVAVAGFLLFAVRPEYVVLFSNLTKSDTTAIEQDLDSMKVPYQISQGGTAVLVPRNQVDAARIKLAQDGLPTSNGVGLEFLNNPSLYDTDQTLNLKYLRAQETELERTISQIDGIQWARVHLVIPKSSVFVEKEDKPTAAVEVQLTPSAHLSPEQVRAIVSLVAHSVEGLSPSDVSVIDTEGNLLSSMLSDSESPTKLTMTQLEIEQRFERDLQNRIQSMLDNTLGLTDDGFHKAYVQVKADLDFDSKVIDQTTYMPQADGKGIVRSEQTNREQLQGQKPTVGGVPGTTSNIPGYPAVTSAPMSYTKEQVTTNYEITSQKEHIKPPVGVNLKQLNIAVAVDSTTIPRTDYQGIRNLVASAAGISLGRGDSLAVEPLPFDESYRKKMDQEYAQEESSAKLQYDFTHLIIPALVIFAVVAIVLLAFLRRTKKTEEPTFSPSGLMAPPIPPEFFTPPQPQAVEEQPAERKKLIEMMRAKGEEKMVLRDEVEEFINSNPGAAAELIRSWLNEREGSQA